MKCGQCAALRASFPCDECFRGGMSERKGQAVGALVDAIMCRDSMDVSEYCVGQDEVDASWRSVLDGLDAIAELLR